VAQIIEGMGAINLADELIVGGQTPEEHHENLCAVFRRFQKFGMKINLEKAKLLFEILPEGWSAVPSRLSDREVGAARRSPIAARSRETHRYPFFCSIARS